MGAFEDFLLKNSAPQDSTPQGTDTGAATPPPPDTSSSAASSGGSFEDYLMRGGTSVSAPASTPAPTAAPSSSTGQSLVSDDKPWYKKAWDFVNEPLLDSSQIESWTGMERSFGGFGKGFENLLSGLTSPLSLALAIGTFGESTLFESGGMAALKAAGIGAEQIAEITKGSQIVSDALRTGQATTEAEAFGLMSKAGINPDTVRSGFEALKDAGMTPESLMKNGIIRRGFASGLRKLDLTPAQAENVGRGIQALTDFGFAGQNLYGAAIASPRLLDALKEGDYETAKQLAVELAGTGGLGVLGMRHAFKQSGALMSDIGAGAGLWAKPTDEQIQMRGILDNQNATFQRARRNAELFEEGLRERFPDIKPDDLRVAMRLREAGMEEDVMAQRYNLLSESLGKDERLPVKPAPTPISGLGLPIKVNDYTTEASNNFINLKKDGNSIGYVMMSDRPDLAPGAIAIDSVEVFKNWQSKGYGTAIYDEAAKQAQKQGGKFLVSDSDWKDTAKTLPGRSEDAERMWQALESKLPGRVSKIGDRYWLDLDPNQSDREMSDLRFRELIEAGHNKKATDADKLLAAYDPRKVTPKMRELVNEIDKYEDESLTRAQQHGVLADGIENHSTHIWGKDATDNQAVNTLLHQARSGDFDINTHIAKKRLLMSSFEGEMLGKRLAVEDPIALAAYNRTEIEKVIATRAALAELMDKGTKASDGRPAIVMPAKGQVVQGEDGPATLVNPNRVRSIRIPDKLIKGMEQRGDLQRMLKEGKITKIGDMRVYPQTGISIRETGQPGVNNIGELRPIYAWNPNDYLSMNHRAFRDWFWASGDTSGNPVLFQGNLMVHPDFHEYLAKRLNVDQRGLARNAVGKVLLGAGREAKGMLLAFSPFHIMQEGLRAIMTGVSPFGIEKWDLNDPVLFNGVKHGLTLGPDYDGVQSFEEGKMAGHSKVVAKIPGLGQMQNWIQDFLFNKYIPGLKARGYRALVDRYQSAHPEWSLDKAAEVAAADTNERFGGLNYKRMGRDVVTQDLFRIVSLAPDWLESEVRFMARVFGTEGRVARADMAKFAIGLWASARILNYLTTGEAHHEAPFGVVTKDKDGKEKTYSIRTMPTDMLHAVSDPGNFLSGRVAPLLRSAAQMYTGRDEFGRKIPTHNLFIDMAQNIAPIPVQTAVKAATGVSSDISNSDQVAKAAGFTVFPYRTEAQKLAAKLASDHAETGPVDQANIRKHQFLIRAEDDVRSGQMSPDDVFKMVESGSLPIKDAKTIMKNVKETREMPADMARLWTRVSRLPMDQVLQVWDQATNSEKVVLGPLLVKKRTQYYKKMVKEMTPQERMKDETYLKLRMMFPEVAPF